MRLLLVLLSALLAGCAGTTTSQIDAKDGAFVPSLRVAVDLGGDGAVPPSEVHAGHALEFGLAGARGDATQTLNPGDLPVRFGGQTFNSPQQLHHEFRFGYAEALYRYRWLWGGKGNFGLEVVGGLGYAGVDLKVSGPAQSAREDFANGGLVFGGGFVGRLSSALSLQARLSLFGSASTEGVTGMSRYDIFLAYALGSHSALRGGFSSWTVRSGREATDVSISGKSPITIRFAGPALGLELMF